jgi:hypothetical protein
MMAEVHGVHSGKFIIKEKEQISHPERLAHKGWLMRQTILVLIMFSIIFGLCVWSPWITQDRATTLAETQFNQAWNGVADGCGTYGNDLGAKDFRKVPFGAYVILDYQCGLVMPDETALHTTMYVSFFGIAFGYPKP